MSYKLSFSMILEVTQEEIFSYFEQEEALFRMAPPWEKISIVHKDQGIDVGSIVHVKIGHKNWMAKHIVSQRPIRFEAVQLVGPFKWMHHIHVFNKVSDTETEIVDEIEFTPRGGAFIGKFLFKYIRSRITKMMNYRYRVLKEDFRHIKKNPIQKNKKILISGASGFVGYHVKEVLGLFGYDVYSLVRKEVHSKKEIYWDPDRGIVDANQLEGFDAVIHLGGESIFSLRWTRSKKERIIESRIKSTSLLVQKLNELYYKPKTFICASAVGFYGNSGGKVVDETSPKGSGFLSDVADMWEKTAQQFTKGRVVNLRFGVVLGNKGGMLKRVSLLFKLGFGAVIGKGSEWMSWISIDDLVYQIAHILTNPDIKGAVNLTSPECVTSKEFAETLGNVSKRKVLFRIPSFLIKKLFGEASSLFLMSTKAFPKKLVENRAYFSYPTLFETLKNYISK